MKRLEPRSFHTLPAAPSAENAAALDPCFLRHLVPTELGSGVRVEERQGPCFEFFAARYGCPSVQAWGVLPPRRIMVAVVSHAEAPVRVNGLDCARHTLLLFGEGSPIFIRAESPVTYVACRMERSQLPLAWQVVLSASASEPASFLHVRLPAEQGLRWADDLGRLAGLSEGAGSRAQVAVPVAEREMRSLLADLASPSTLPLRVRRSPQARRQAQLAAALLYDAGDGKLGVPDLMQRLGVRRRTLEYEINDLAGMSPHAWLTALRLDRVRVELMHREASAGVGDIAARWGFLHQGRFARAYRARFGELPRITAARAARRQAGGR